jgi:hypothetical protein
VALSPPAIQRGFVDATLGYGYGQEPELELEL